jgi:hypothetical protein
MMHVTEFARQIVEMDDRIMDLEWQVERLKEYEFKYNQLLDQALAHNMQMTGSLMLLGLKMVEERP